MVADDFLCQDCGQKTWKAALTTPLGYMYLCGYCADDALENREASKDLKAQNNFARLVKRIFGKNI